MKALIAIVVAALVGVPAVSAHERGEHASISGAFGLQPEYVHVLLNPLPVYGLGLGTLALLAAWLAKSRKAEVIALVMVVVCAASAWPTLYYGQHGYNHLYQQLDYESQQWLDVHMHRAEQFIYAFYATALLGIAALVCFRKFPRAARALSLITILAGCVSLGIGAWISRAGGQVSHSEFRSEEPSGEPPAKAPARPHGAPAPSQEKMQPSDTSGGHKHAAPSGQAAGKTEKAPLPDTPEAVWKAIHEHRSELESAVKDKKFSDVQSHAESLRALAKRLGELFHPDHKSVVESGVNRINQALEALKQSAETGSELVTKNNFQEFGKALNELEQQMKKQ